MLCKSHGVVIPMSFKKRLFPVAFLDNLDVATKTTLSTTFLHEAAASLNQHPKMLDQRLSREKKSSDSKQ